MTLVNSIYSKFPFLVSRLRFINKFNGRNFLDFGCGSGDVLRQNLLLKPELEIFAVDIVDHREQIDGTGCFSLFDGENLPFKNDMFDLGTANHVFEHISNRIKVLKEIHRVMKPNGKFYIETPNKRSLSKEYLRGRFAGSVHFKDDPTHVAPLSEKDLANLGKEAGFKVIETGISRNWLHVLLSPFLLIAGLCMPQKLYFMYARNSILGWASYIILEKTTNEN